VKDRLDFARHIRTKASPRQQKTLLDNSGQFALPCERLGKKPRSFSTAQNDEVILFEWVIRIRFDRCHGRLLRDHPSFFVLARSM